MAHSWNDQQAGASSLTISATIPVESQYKSKKLFDLEIPIYIFIVDMHNVWGHVVKCVFIVNEHKSFKPISHINSCLSTQIILFLLDLLKIYVLNKLFTLLS